MTSESDKYMHTYSSLVTDIMLQIEKGKNYALNHF